MNSYLALGDSYTIGEMVPFRENFPNQLASMLPGWGIQMADPVIIATTGWTTDELNTAIREKHISGTFDVVTLLIGVNNQYRGRSVENYKEEFLDLLHQAITFAGGRVERVFVISIPDWGATPFADGRDRQKIATEIDAYNDVNRFYAADHNCPYLGITQSTRENAVRNGYLAEDGLHPSSMEYRIWAELLAPLVARALNA